MGTGDLTAYFCVPAAIDFLEKIYGWEKIRQDNRSQALTARKIIAESLGVELPCPESMIGSMAVSSPPDHFPTLAPGQLIPPVQEKLFQEYAIEVLFIILRTYKIGRCCGLSEVEARNIFHDF